MTEYYVSALASGGGDGSVGNPFTLAEAIAEINTPTVWADGDRMNLKNDGTYTTSGITISNEGNVSAFSTISGYSSNPGDGGKATILRSGGSSHLILISGRFWNIDSFILDGNNSGLDNLRSWGITNISFKNVESKNAGDNGFVANSIKTSVFNCYSHDNANYGFAYGNCFNCIAYNNGNSGFYLASAINCISKDNSGVGFINNDTYISVINCIADNNAEHGIFVNDPASVVLNCIIRNSPVGKQGIYINRLGSTIKNINFDNCVNKSNVMSEIGTYYELDSEFNDPFNLDYTRTGTNLDDLGFSQIGLQAAINYNIDIGIDQKEASSGGEQSRVHIS